MLDEGQEEPITLYFWTTPNGFKISIMLEEIGAPYRVEFIDINKGEQFAPAFLAVSPNNRIPAIVDPEGPDGQPLAVFESGAILQYLGRKFGALYPSSERAKADVDQWLFWQVGGLGPMAGQSNHFRRTAPEKIPYAIERYRKEVERLFGVMDKRLSDRPYLAGAYSIADIASFPWVRTWEALAQDIKKFPNVERWLDLIAARPAVIKGLALKKADASRAKA
ncbi:MAG TPA: glutathione binding-like protein [Hyphomicrobium sp.]|jgi:GST-like protein|uniref:glutathione binding-like protein n=1 Tax=Hyphomicrobium sp. TaxID=82 RepID=UPI002BE6EEC1|nr:glutathione binding-like protein [Hyphomicrobium sp.]HXE00973.1 glutathione binding-like protein [Hyphomicrobium sp.]